MEYIVGDFTNGTNVTSTSAPTAVESAADLRQRAINAVLKATAYAAVRHDHAAVASFSAALVALEGGN